MSHKRTYAARPARLPLPPSPLILCTSPPPPSRKRKSPFIDTGPPRKKLATIPAQKLTQLHLSFDGATPVKSCTLCALSYTRGVPDDEALHKAYCARVQRAFQWRREDEKDTDARVIDHAVRLPSGTRGRIVCVPADASGKLGPKVAVLLETMDAALAASPLSAPVLRQSKAYIFIAAATSSAREQVAGCLIAQRITTAMAVVPTAATSAVLTSGLCYNPKPLPTALGIPRLFVTTTHRRRGIARALLDAAMRTSVHGCELDPRKGDVAFSQPTSMGRAVMEGWGGGGVRVYDEDEHH